MVLKNTLPMLIAALLCSACGITYLAQATRGQLAVMHARQPIDRVLARADTSDALKAQLLRARRIRDFASRELGLPDNAAYRSYADIHRRFVVWNVIATPEFSVQPRQWCFPVAGCVAYRGYFSEHAAEAFAATRRQQGDDVVVGGVPAYSTLGHAADPLLNTVIGYSELALAGLVFHELAHQVVYLPGDSAFNEAFATAVEEAGVARYAANLGDVGAPAREQATRDQRVELTTLVIAAREELARLYAGADSTKEKRVDKAARLAQLADSIRRTEQRNGRVSGFGRWIDAGLNNAHLASVATYYDQVPHFEQLLRERCGGYLPCFYVEVAHEAAARRSAEKKKGPA
jgi:predicted aminopeptidase